MQTIPPSADLLSLSADLLYRARTQQDVEDLVHALDRFSLQRIPIELTDDARRKACWINLYNAWTLLLLRKQPETYNRRTAFFARPSIPIAGHLLSLNDIEHGILRKGAIWWSLGYLRNPWGSSLLASLALTVPDPRIHFALNCGAASCPPVRAYLADQIDAQLDLAAAAYLQGGSIYDQQQNRIGLPRLFLWFHGDFGGRAGIRKMLTQYGIIAPGTRPGMYYLPYNWTLKLDQMADEI